MKVPLLPCRCGLHESIGVYIILSKILRVKFSLDLRVNKRLTCVRVKFGIVILNSSGYFHSNPSSENFHSRVTSETLTG